jgi:hypothetical protein
VPRKLRRLARQYFASQVLLSRRSRHVDVEDFSVQGSLTNLFFIMCLASQEGAAAVSGSKTASQGQSAGAAAGGKK